MYKYLVYWMIAQLATSSNPPAPKNDLFGNRPFAIVTCDTLSMSVEYNVYYREFSSRDSAKAYKLMGDSTQNVKWTLLDSVLIVKDSIK